MRLSSTEERLWTTSIANTAVEVNRENDDQSKSRPTAVSILIAGLIVELNAMVRK